MHAGRTLFDGMHNTGLPGVAHWRGRIAPDKQKELLGEIAILLAAAPPFRPRMRNGVPMINRISNCGSWGWLSDERGYRYEDRHPETGAPWPAMPCRIVNLARAAAAEIGCPGFEPDACLINIYESEGKLNLHRDEDEQDLSWPIVSVSLGASAVFALGGLARKDRARDILLESGDMLVLSGRARMVYHGVKRLKGRGQLTHDILPEGGRINLTVRRAR